MSLEHLKPSKCQIEEEETPIILMLVKNCNTGRLLQHQSKGGRHSGVLILLTCNANWAIWIIVVIGLKGKWLTQL